MDDDNFFKRSRDKSSNGMDDSKNKGLAVDENGFAIVPNRNSNL